jgi:aubergine-like protein
MRSDGWIKALKEQLNEGVQMVVLILPGAKGKSQLYDDIKRFLLTEYPIPSQVVLAQTISRGKNLRSIISKVLIQMCAKLGGIPWAVDNLPFMDKPTMICGLDVFHATSLGKKSVLALSASMNNSATTYWSTSVVQDDIGQEASNSLCTGMSAACEAFKRSNGAYPAQIIFYRDGVGEGQIEGVCRAEINQIKQALSGLGLGEATKLMYINTSKRVNTRLFAGQPGRFQNPLPGTVVDADITDRDVYEFYLVSVAAR